MNKYILLFLITFLIGCSQTNSISKKYQIINTFLSKIKQGDYFVSKVLVCDNNIDKNKLDVLHDILIKKGLPDTSKYIIEENYQLAKNIYETQIQVNLLDTSENDKKYVYVKAYFIFNDGICSGKISSIHINWIPREWIIEN